MKRVALVALACAACGSPAPEAAGAGGWDVTQTRLKDATGRCQPTDLPDGRKGTWCFLQPALSLDGQNAQVDLYFGGTDPDAALIEVQLKLTSCDREKADAWAGARFGAATERKGDRSFRQNRYVSVALIPSGAQCLIRILPLSEQAELARIKTAP